MTQQYVFVPAGRIELLTQEMKKMKHARLTELQILTPKARGSLLGDKSCLPTASLPEAAFV